MGIPVLFKSNTRIEPPCVDAEAAVTVVGAVEHREMGLEGQRQSLVLLQNQCVLLLAEGASVYAIGMAHDALSAAGFKVTDGGAEDRASAYGLDAAIVRVTVRNVNTCA